MDKPTPSPADHRESPAKSTGSTISTGSGLFDGLTMSPSSHAAPQTPVTSNRHVVVEGTTTLPTPHLHLPLQPTSVTGAPVTDKLLGLLESKSSATRTTSTKPTTPAPVVATKKEEAIQKEPDTFGAYLSGWFGSGSNNESTMKKAEPPAGGQQPQNPIPVVPPPTPAALQEEKMEHGKKEDGTNTLKIREDQAAITSEVDDSVMTGEKEVAPAANALEDEELTQEEDIADDSDCQEHNEIVEAADLAAVEQAMLEAEKALENDDDDSNRPVMCYSLATSLDDDTVLTGEGEERLPSEVTLPENHGTELQGGQEPHQQQDNAATAAEKEEADDEPEVVISRKEMDAKDQKALDEAFESTHAETPPAAASVATSGKGSQKPQRPMPPIRVNSEFTPLPKVRGLGQVHPDTPVPNADVCLRLLRKFARKTRSRIVTTYGGTKPLSLFGYFFNAKQDPTYVPYKMLMDILFENESLRDPEDELQDDSEAENIVDGILGEAGDTMERARRALAVFVFLFSQWGHASAHLFENKDARTRESFSDLLAAVFNAASTLVAHGCLDHVLMLIGDDVNHREAIPITNLLTQSVLAADLNPERNELAAMKFLLSAGCRNYEKAANGNVMLGGSHLLQTIRMLYHIFLTTESTNNKTAARAALQQLVTQVFGRMAAADAGGMLQKTDDGFPSDHHRNAFLVLRAICKLSMRTLPDGAMHSHIGFQASGSNETWDGAEHHAEAPNSHMQYSAEGIDSLGGGGTHEHAQLIYTSAIHPALESKILALDLIHYVLTHTEFSPEFVERSGPQFHAAIRNYLCVSLLKNCTSMDTHVVNLSLRIFVPVVSNFRTILKNEIEAFVTNVFFVILDSPNSSPDHKGLVVRTFEEICSDPATLAEIFLNYDCDLSAVDLFHRIVNTLSRISRTGMYDNTQSPSYSLSSIMMAGTSSNQRQEKIRFETRELRLDAMKALRQVLASLHASIVPQNTASLASFHASAKNDGAEKTMPSLLDAMSQDSSSVASPSNAVQSQNPVQVYGNKKKRRAEEAEAILRFNQKPAAGIAYAARCGHLEGQNPAEIAKWLKDGAESLDKTMIGDYLGREAEYQNGLALQVLHEYVRLFDFGNLVFDDAIRYFLSGFRLPGEAQKIDRIMEKFAERFTEQNPTMFPSADVAFILSFSIIMLNTDLHNPAIKEDRRMTQQGFIRNNRGICDGQDLPDDMLISIFQRIRDNPISLKEDDEARQRAAGNASNKSAMSPASFFTNRFDEMDRARETNFRKERDHILRTTESLLKRRRHHPETTVTGTPGSKLAAASKTGAAGDKAAGTRPKSARLANQRFVQTKDSGLRDEYVAPMFEVTWGPALAAFSIAMESANGTQALLAIATDEELEIAAENVAETIEVCLTGFKFAICTAGLCQNDVARDSYMLALARFSQLGTGTLLEHRHVRCIQTLLSLAREHGELLGTSWQHVFRALSEINRFHQLFQLMARNDRAAAAAAERRRKRLLERESRRRARQERKTAIEDSDSVADADWDMASTSGISDIGSLAESDIFSDEEDLDFDDDMDAKAIDEANARLVYDGVSEDVIEVIYERSSSLSTEAIKVFVSQLCYVSSMEISVGYGSKDLNHVSYRQQHALIQGSSSHGHDSQFHHTQPNIYNLQKLVEVAHYNMESRSRLVFADLWSTIASHLTQTCLHKNPALAMYAVDSFRQLSIQFLQRDELEVFEFQRRFLKPLETVMARSNQSGTKELLLSCVARVIQVFDSSGSPTKSKGGLRSGWVPLLVVLGLGGQDNDENIARLSQEILSSQIKQCCVKSHPSALLTEHFAETVDSVFMCANGPHLELSIQSMDACSLLAQYLGDDGKETPHLKHRASSSLEQTPEATDTSSNDLELWWPLLIGVSRVAGDNRPELRSKAMDVLFGIINSHFFGGGNESGKNEEDSIQRVQLVFRGILTPMLEFAEIGSGRPPRLPKDFERFMTTGSPTTGGSADDSEESWLEGMFGLFMDACIALCKRTKDLYQTDIILEEVFAILNHCLVSDSGALAVWGIYRLEQFVTSDLDASLVTDDVWATVCHMLRRCLTVRGLPIKPSESAEEYEMSVREFIAEERMLSDRRYLGSHAVMVIGNLLSSERTSQSMGFLWTLFLIRGLGRGIAAWEEAAKLPLATETGSSAAPSYLETAYYGRRWMNRFLIQLASMDEVATAAGENAEGGVYKSAQQLVLDETEELLLAFVEAEKTVNGSHPKKIEAALYSRLAKLATQLLKEYASMRHEHVQRLAWINPVLLSSCISSKNEDVLSAIQQFITLTENPVNKQIASSVQQHPADEEPAQASSETDEQIHKSLFESAVTEEECSDQVNKNSNEINCKPDVTTSATVVHDVETKFAKDEHLGETNPEIDAANVEAGVANLHQVLPEEEKGNDGVLPNDAEVYGREVEEDMNRSSVELSDEEGLATDEAVLPEEEKGNDGVLLNDAEVHGREVEEDINRSSVELFDEKGLATDEMVLPEKEKGNDDVLPNNPEVRGREGEEDINRSSVELSDEEGLATDETVSFISEQEEEVPTIDNGCTETGHDDSVDEFLRWKSEVLGMKDDETFDHPLPDSNQ